MHLCAYPCTTPADFKLLEAAWVHLRAHCCITMAEAVVVETICCRAASLEQLTCSYPAGTALHGRCWWCETAQGTHTEDVMHEQPCRLRIACHTIQPPMHVTAIGLCPRLRPNLNQSTWGAATGRQVRPVSSALSFVQLQACSVTYQTQREALHHPAQQAHALHLGPPDG